jgi:hypothetical protein
VSGGPGAFEEGTAGGLCYGSGAGFPDMSG